MIVRPPIYTPKLKVTMNWAKPPQYPAVKDLDRDSFGIRFNRPKNSPTRLGEIKPKKLPQSILFKASPMSKSGRNSFTNILHLVLSRKILTGINNIAARRKGNCLQLKLSWNFSIKLNSEDLESICQ